MDTLNTDKLYMSYLILWSLIIKRENRWGGKRKIIFGEKKAPFKILFFYYKEALLHLCSNAFYIIKKKTKKGKKGDLLLHFLLLWWFLSGAGLNRVVYLWAVFWSRLVKKIIWWWDSAAVVMPCVYCVWLSYFFLCLFCWCKRFYYWTQYKHFYFLISEKQEISVFFYFCG